MTDIIYY